MEPRKSRRFGALSLCLLGAAFGGLQCTEEVRTVGYRLPTTVAGAAGAVGSAGAGVEASAGSMSFASGGAADPPAQPLEPFSPPQIISELSDPNAMDSEPTLSADELEIYFRSDRLGFAQIFVATRQSRSDRWTAPTLAVEFVSPNGGASFSPELSGDGLSLVFASDRPGGAGSADMYLSTRPTRTEAWSVPVNLAELNTSTCEIDPGPALERNQMVVTRCNERGYNQLYWSERTAADAPWSPPTYMDPLNSDEKEGDPVFAQNGLVLYFATTRDSPNRDDRADIWRTTRAALDQPFEAPTPVEELNILEVDDQDPWVSNDERHIVFTSRRDRGTSEIYQAWR